FRQPFGSYFDNFAPSDVAVTGVTIRMGPDYGTKTQSLLLDATPETFTWNDAPLPVGRTMTDPLSRVSFTTVSVSPTGAVVNVAFGVDGSAPSRPGNLTGEVGSNWAAMSWTASTDNQSVTGYRVWRGSTFLGTTTGLNWTVSGLTAGVTYRLMVVAVD